jgi:hypothetical protein
MSKVYCRSRVVGRPPNDADAEAHGLRVVPVDVVNAHEHGAPSRAYGSVVGLTGSATFRQNDCAIAHVDTKIAKNRLYVRSIAHFHPFHVARHGHAALRGKACA